MRASRFRMTVVLLGVAGLGLVACANDGEEAASQPATTGVTTAWAQAAGARADVVDGQGGALG